VWPATPPRILVTPYASWTNDDHRYLLGVFDDLRLCLSCGGSSLEVRFGARIVAHVGLGRVPPDGDVLSLLTVSYRFGNVYFDTCPESIAIDPRDVQWIAASADALEGTGPFAAFAGLDAASRAAALDGLEPMLPTIVDRALRPMRASLVPFQSADGPVDRQVYDGFINAQLTPVRAGVYVALGPLDMFRPILPTSDGKPPLVDITDMPCGDARRTIAALGSP